MAYPVNNNYEIQPFPRARRLVLDAGWNALRRHMIHGFLELDVTVSRERIRQHTSLPDGTVDLKSVEMFATRTRWGLE